MISRKTEVILGIDPGTGRLGFGVISSDGTNHQMLDAGIITTPAHTPLYERLDVIYSELSLLINQLKPSVMVVEKLFFAQNITTAISVSHARGVILLTGKQAGLKLVEYTPLQIKQSMTGYGRATKKQVQEMVRVSLKLKDAPKQDDCADALAAAIVYATSTKLDA